MRYNLLLFYWMLFLSCSAQIKEVISKSEIKLRGQITEIENLIDVDGYFSLPNDPYSGNYMFFKDGSYVYFHFKRGVLDNEKKSSFSKSIDSWSKKGQLQWGSYWGVYTLKNDTIIVNSYVEGLFLRRGWSLTQTRYKVLNRKTIQNIYYKSLLKSGCNTNDNPWMKTHPLFFFPIDVTPSSNNWLKEKKWIWHNESDWEEYMKRIKLEKK